MLFRRAARRFGAPSLRWRAARGLLRQMAAATAQSDVGHIASHSVSNDSMSGTASSDVGRWLRIWNWTTARRALRVARIGALTMSVWSAGYAAGMHGYAADPEGTQKAQLAEILRKGGPHGEDAAPMDRGSPEVRQMERVFPLILSAAREEVASLEAKARRELHENEDGRQQQKLEKLLRAKAQLKEWQEHGFLVVDVNSPNAFVHALVPRILFINRGVFWYEHYRPVGCGMDQVASLASKSKVAVRIDGSGVGVLRWWPAEIVAPHVSAGYVVRLSCDQRELVVAAEDMMLVERHQIIENDEQLAMLLGHELSHVVHDHADGSMKVLAAAAACQIMLLAVLDPTGLLSFLFELGLGGIAKYGLELPYSRAREIQADETGLRICARANFDTTSAVTFMDRLLAYEDLVGKPGASAWAQTHPRTEDRSRTLRAIADAQGAAKSTV
mmetsp:Transcript_43196/g.119464  ORF Transcript_43196/g.119464 Transcript_43196/m.119464 type:complete len:444 (+) Transcript_43196:63-1394(+)